jgi:hypothetical protein
MARDNVLTFIDVEIETLSLLSMGPCSFAALHRYLVIEMACDNNVLTTWDLIAAMESSKYIALSFEPDSDKQTTAIERMQAMKDYQDWLGAAEVSQTLSDVSVTSYDKVGLWLSLTTLGQRVATILTRDEPRWLIQFDEVSRVVSVFASTLDVAEAAVSMWCSRADMQIESTRIEYVDQFEMSGGHIVAPAVVVVAQTADRTRIKN